jgi:aspartyl-tRNA(Asn)/glutamyl-tRNA(Gln) amidotransferase subunit A
MTRIESISTVRTSSAADALPMTITDAAAALRTGTITAVELTRRTIARAEVLDPVLGCYINRTDETALTAAATADAELQSGLDRGLLHGVPIGVKDIITTRDAPTTAQSLIMDRAFGESGDAPVVARLRAAGAVITGKTTTMEYAIGAPDPSKGFPTPRNPFGLDRWTGGSSSGTGNGVAAGLMLGGLGTDTGGSVRMPASWCGISGMKQTFGRVPKSGCVPLGFSYDNIGPMARSAADCAAMLSVMAGHDDSDPGSVDRPVDDYLGALTGEVAGLKVGVDYSFIASPNCGPGVAEMFHAAISIFEAADAEVVSVTLPLYDMVSMATTAGATAEAFAYHRTDLASRWDDYGSPTRTSIALGALVGSSDYVQAQRVRRAGIRAANDLFRRVDVVLTPTHLIGAPLLDQLDFRALMPIMLMSYWNGLGFPAMSIPMGLTPDGFPVGLQVCGKPFDESTVFRAADAFQSRTDHHLVEPPILKQLLG